MPHGYRQSNARRGWLRCPYLSANYVADCPPNMAQVSVYKDERPGKRQSPWSISNQAFFRLSKKNLKKLALTSWLVWGGFVLWRQSP